MRRSILSVLMLVVLGASVILTGCAAEEELVIRYSTDHQSSQASAYAEKDVLAPTLEEMLPNCKAQIYQGGSLYKPIEALNQLVAGNLELAAVDSDGGGWDPWCNIFATPMVLTTPGAHFEFKNTSVAKTMEDRMLPKGIRILGWMCESMMGGIGAAERILNPDQMTGKKFRISAPLVQGPMVEALGSSPMAISGGDMPSALQTGVVDAVITTVGGFNVTKDVAPYYTVFGAGGLFTDFYMCCASEIWYQSLSAENQGLLQDAIDHWLDEFYMMQYAEDMLGYEKYGTLDPTKPGIYLASPEEVAAVKAAIGTSIGDSLATELDAAAQPVIAAFASEGAALVAKWPVGSHPIEKINPEDYRSRLYMD